MFLTNQIHAANNKTRRNVSVYSFIEANKEPIYLKAKISKWRYSAKGRHGDQWFGI